jgi:hypothetical protein
MRCVALLPLIQRGGLTRLCRAQGPPSGSLSVHTIFDRIGFVVLAYVHSRAPSQGSMLFHCFDIYALSLSLLALVLFDSNLKFFLSRCGCFPCRYYIYRHRLPARRNHLVESDMSMVLLSIKVLETFSVL